MATARRQKTTPELVCEENELLGRGSYGKVYKGKYRGQSVAVKKVSRDDLPENKEESQREQEAMRILDHPNILKLLHVEDQKDFKY